ncbi:MAG TPA: lysophospholipid acyltransferase family protein [Sphingomicrobium sp.]|nr:lysophospholipid acyltransferase family protein [Sphingomicrobium sp.]
MNARAIARVAAVILLFVVTAPVHLLCKLMFGRSPVPPRFLGAVAWLIGVRAQVTGAKARPHSLLICNHTSWIDILVTAASTNCAFVSKDALGHPIIHWLADQNDTVYVKRGHVKGAKDQAVTIARALESDKPVALFPEGTTGPGTHLLPFRSTLLEAANYAAKDVEIRPVALDYGAARAEVGWWQEPGKDNVMRMLGRRGTLPVAVRLLPALDRSGDRKQLTEQARESIAGALGFKSAAHSPIATDE